MTVKRLDHVGIVFEDLDAGIAFFTELGLEVEGRMPIEGKWVDRVNGIDGVKVDIAMMRTPDGHGRLELTRFRAPALVDATPKAPPPNTLGLRNLMFAVDDIHDVIERLRKHGGELMGAVEDYEETYRLCYMRGPAGIIVALAQELRG